MNSQAFENTCPVFIAVVFVSGLINSKIRFIRQAFGELLISRLKRGRYFLSRFAEHSPRNIQMQDFFEKLLNRRERHMAAAFHESSHCSNVCAEQAAFLNFVRQRGNDNFSSFGFEVFACPMLSDNVKFFRQRNLLDNIPVVQRYQTIEVCVTKLVFDNTVDFISGKGLSRMLSMSWLTAAFSFFSCSFLHVCFRLNDIRRRWLRGIIGILLQPCYFFFQLLNTFHKRFNFFDQFDNNGIFILHSLFITQGAQKRKLPILTL